MARIAKGAKTNTRNKRLDLPAQREPYWTTITTGRALGYRKGAKGGTWIARYRDDAGKQHYQALGEADDTIDSDGGGLVLSYGEAHTKALAWFAVAEHGFQEATPRSGPYTVKQAMEDYLSAYERNGGKASDRTRWAVDALILPTLGDIPLAKLKQSRIEAWHDALATAPRRLRTKSGQPQKFAPASQKPEDVRRRQSSANRVLTILRAALNHAHSKKKVPTDEAWRALKSFREVDAARVRYLNDQEARRLVNAAGAEFRPLVQAGLLTGCRYGELTALTVADFNPDSGTVSIRVSKSGKPRHVILTTEGQKFFAAMAKGKRDDAVLIARADGTAWGKSHQHRPFKAALKAAKLSDMAFHELRHTYASRLVMKGVPLPVVAAQLGHTDTRMVEKHYGHMSASYIADAVRAAFTDMGLVTDTNVVSIGEGAAA